jgi:hypothetical protein
VLDKNLILLSNHENSLHNLLNQDTALKCVPNFSKTLIKEYFSQGTISSQLETKILKVGKVLEKKNILHYQK